MGLHLLPYRRKLKKKIHFDPRIKKRLPKRRRRRRKKKSKKNQTQKRRKRLTRETLFSKRYLVINESLSSIENQLVLLWENTRLATKQ
jgi:hypothetical protein